MQLSLFRADDGRLPYAVDLTELFGAFEACLRHKRKTAGAQAFALDYEENQIQNGSIIFTQAGVAANGWLWCARLPNRIGVPQECITRDELFIDKWK